MTVDEAVVALGVFEEETGIALEFSVNFRDVTDPGQVGRIIATNPAVGTTVKQGQSILIIVGKPAPGDD